MYSVIGNTLPAEILFGCWWADEDKQTFKVPHISSNTHVGSVKQLSVLSRGRTGNLLSVSSKFCIIPHAQHHMHNKVVLFSSHPTCNTKHIKYNRSVLWSLRSAWELIIRASAAGCCNVTVASLSSHDELVMSLTSRLNSCLTLFDWVRLT